MHAPLNPYTQRLIDPAPESFIGRRSHLEPILRGVSASAPVSFAIRGARGIGETAMLKDMCDLKGASVRYKEALLLYMPDQEQRRLAFLYLDVYNSTPDDLFKHLLARLIKHPEVARRLPAEMLEEAQVSLTPEAVKTALQVILENLAEQTVRLAVCLDHFDNAYKGLKYSDDNFLRSLTNQHAFVFVTEKNFSELMASNTRYSPLGNKLRMLPPLGLLEEDEARGLVEAPARQSGRPFSPRTVDFILEAAGRHPYLLNLVSEYIFNQLLPYPIQEQEVLLRKKDIQEQFQAQLLALPAVDDLFRMLWKSAMKDGQEQLAVIAQGKPAETHAAAIYGRLAQDSLLWFDLKTGRYQIFGELFRQFTLKQQPAAAPDLLDQVLAQLSAQDARLLRYLADHPGQVFSSEELIQQIWTKKKPSERGFEAALHRVRLKYREFGGEAPIHPVRGQGIRYGV
ncbi:MAG: helix-turn-helix domain-containing protein [Chloroflexi bacterium]|nr:helix-turn-helix domain-containing protein [Chloroflexota bacterium]